MKPITSIERHHGRYLPWAAGSAAFIGLAGTLWALSEVLENDSDGDGWTDTEEVVAGTNPADETDPWDSDGDGIADYLEFINDTDPLDPNGPPEFNHHWIVKVNGFLYDPSYGTEKSSENNVADYENKAFDGYCLVSDAFLIRKNEGERDVYYSEY